MSFGVMDGQTCPVQNQRNNLPRGMLVEKSIVIDKSFEKTRSTTATTSSFGLNIPDDDFNSSP